MYMDQNKIERERKRENISQHKNESKLKEFDQLNVHLKNVC